MIPDRGKMRTLFPFGVIIFVWCMFCVPFFVRGLVPFPSGYLVSFFAPWDTRYGMPVKNEAMPDLITQIYPWKKLVVDSWKQGEIPLWNPFAFSGTPLAGNYQSAAFSPVNILFMLMPMVQAWSFSVLLQPLVAGLGMLLLVRSLGRSRMASAISAVAFMFSGFFVTWMGYQTLGWAAAFLPYVWLGVRRMSVRASPWNIPLVSVGIAWSLLSGHFQISLYVVAAGIFFAVWEWWKTKDPHPLAVALIAVGLGILIAAPQLVLTFHAYAESTRSSSFIRAEVIPWKYLATVFAPDFFGNPVTRNDWFGHYAEWASYVGVVPLFFALVSLWGWRKRDDRRACVLLAVVSLLLAYESPLLELLFALKIPVLSTSAASRIIVLFSFSLALLAAYGFDDMKGLWQAGKKFGLFRNGLVAVFLMVLPCLLVLMTRGIPVDRLATAKRNLVLPLLLVSGTFLLYWVGSIRKMSGVRVVLVCLFLVLACFDSYRYATKWMPFEPSGLMYPELPVIARLRQGIAPDRVMGNIGGEVGNTFGVPLTEGYDAMYPARYGEFMNAESSGEASPGGRSVVMFDKNGKNAEPVMRLLGVRYVLHRKSDGRNVWAFPFWKYPEGSMKNVYSDDAYDLMEYIDAYPRVFLASSYMKETGSRSIVNTLFSSDFDGKNSVVLEKDPAIIPAEGSGSAVIRSYGMDALTIETVSDVPKILFLSDTWDSGWRAEVDGKSSELLRADYAFRAVAVPAGTHVVKMRYWPGYLMPACVASAVGCIAVAVLAWSVKRRTG